MKPIKIALGYLFMGICLLLACLMFFIYFILPLVWLIPVYCIFGLQKLCAFADSCMEAAFLSRQPPNYKAS